MYTWTQLSLQQWNFYKQLLTLSRMQTYRDCSNSTHKQTDLQNSATRFHRISYKEVTTRQLTRHWSTRERALIMRESSNWLIEVAKLTKAKWNLESFWPIQLNSAVTYHSMLNFKSDKFTESRRKFRKSKYWWKLMQTNWSWKQKTKKCEDNNSETKIRNGTSERWVALKTANCFENGSRKELKGSERTSPSQN